MKSASKPRANSLTLLTSQLVRSPTRLAMQKQARSAERSDDGREQARSRGGANLRAARCGERIGIPAQERHRRPANHDCLSSGDFCLALQRASYSTASAFSSRISAPLVSYESIQRKTLRISLSISVTGMTITAKGGSGSALPTSAIAMKSLDST
jgi:hypothetical protein